MSSFKIFTIITILFSCQIGSASTGGQLHNLTKIFIEQKIEANTALVEGYVNKKSGSEINYHSPLPQNMDALISRASDGTMRVSWKSGNIPDKEKIQFVWYAGLGINLGEAHFDMSINGEHILSFATVPEKEWTVTGSHQSVLSFKTSFVDGVGDLFGIMVLSLPNTEHWDNQGIELSIIGRPENNNAWYMTFCYNKVAESMLKTKQFGFWYRLRQKMDSGD